MSGDDAAREARRKITAAMDRLEAELERSGGQYLAGGAFSVADLTAACLFVPIVFPPEGPHLPKPSARLRGVHRAARERPGYRWVAETFARHR